MSGQDLDRALAVLRADPDRSALVVAPPERGPGHWAGAPSATLDDTGAVILAYRLRRPVDRGRGYAVVVARSPDGVRLETLVTVTAEQMGASSLERPALVRVSSDEWRLYLSCATHGSKHWRVEVLCAPGPEAFDPTSRRVSLPGDPGTGVKDPVIVTRDGRWHLWAAWHPLAQPGEEDRMVTGYATSTDGLLWSWQGIALQGRAGQWDERGTRVSAVQLVDGAVVAAYDGRASATENCEERSGIAAGSSPDALSAIGTAPEGQTSPDRSVRYLCVLPLPDGGHRLYYEASAEDGTHELRTELRPRS